MFGLAAFQCLAQRQIGGDGRGVHPGAARAPCQNALHRGVDGNDLFGLIHRQNCRLLQRVQHRVELFVSPGLQRATRASSRVSSKPWRMLASERASYVTGVVLTMDGAAAPMVV